MMVDREGALMPTLARSGSEGYELTWRGNIAAQRCRIGQGDKRLHQDSRFSVFL
jgi:hypothetical protein